MSDQAERDRLARLTDAEVLALIDETRGELVVTAGGGYHLMVLPPASAKKKPSAALRVEVNARRQRFYAYAEANTVRLLTLGVDLDAPRHGDPEPRG